MRRAIATRSDVIAEGAATAASAAPDRAGGVGDEFDDFAGDPNFMTSLARGLAVIRGFAQEPRGMSIARLSQKTGIPRAAVRRCLHTLAKLATFRPTTVVTMRCGRA